MRPSAITRSRASAPSTSMLARVVSKWLLFGTMSPGLQHRVEQDALGGASLVRRDDVREAGEVLDDVAEAVERAAARVRLVALHQRAPLRRRHRAGAGVGEQIDRARRRRAAGRRCAPAASSASTRSSRRVNLSASTDLMRNGSMMRVEGHEGLGREPPSQTQAVVISPRRSLRYMSSASGRSGTRRSGP